MMEETAVDLMQTPNIVAIVHAWIPMEATEEILPRLQHQLQEASPPPKVQLGQQEDQQQQDVTRDGLLTGIVMTSTTT